jgi:hypothetical protein
MNVNVIRVRDKRRGDRITGSMVCRKVREIQPGQPLSRTRLSDIERGYVVPGEEEISVIDAAIDSLIDARKALEHMAAEVGWPGAI